MNKKKPQLVLLHFAGGNCYSFQFLAPLLKDFELIVPELPGRGRRMDEALLTDFDEAAQDMYLQINKKISNSDYIIYGHSMGAYIGLRVANMLEKAGLPPACLLVSGNAGPGIREPKNWYLLEGENFMEELKTLGGIREEFIRDPELRAFFEPILKADFEIAERNSLATELPAAAPLYAMMGSLEEDVDKIANWGNYTRSRFDYEVLEGDHFFIHKHPQRIAAVIEHCYRSALLRQQGALNT